MSMIVSAQSIQRPPITYTNDGGELLRVKHIGVGAGTVQVVVASNKIVFKHNGSNDSTIQLGDSAAAGEIVYGGTASPSYQAIVNHINKSPNWRARLGFVLPTEVPSATADPFLNDGSAVDANVIGGIALEHDTSQAFDSTTVFGAGVRVTLEDCELNDDMGVIHYIQQIMAIYTASGNTKIYAVDAATLAVRTIYDRGAGLTSGSPLLTDTNFAATSSITGYGLGSRQGEASEWLVVRLEDTAALTITSLAVSGSYSKVGSAKKPAFNMSDW